MRAVRPAVLGVVLLGGLLGLTACSGGDVQASPPGATATATSQAPATVTTEDGTTTGATPKASTASDAAVTTVAAAPVVTDAPKAEAVAVVAAEPVAAVSEVPLAGAADLEVAVRFYSDAALSGDGVTARRLLSERCQAVLTADAVVAEATARVGGFAPVLGVTRHGKGSSVTVDYTYSSAGHDVTGEAWVQQDGGWRRDAC